MPDFRTVLRGEVYGEDMAIVRYWRTPSATPNFQEMVDDWGAILEGTWDLATHNLCSLTDVYISEATIGSLGAAFTPANFPLEGTLSSTTGLPRHDAVLCVYTSTALAYPRQNRNRLAGANEGQIESGQLSAAALILWQAVADALTTAFTTATETWTPILWSDEYQLGRVISSRTVRQRISTQNSRKT